MIGWDFGSLGLTSRPDWRDGLPLLAGRTVILREPRRGDAPALLRLTQLPEVRRHTWPPPETLDAFERFIEWGRQERADGNYVGFALVPKGEHAAAGILQVRALQPDFSRAEMAFALSPAYWGKGIFLEAVRLVRDFAFDDVLVHRLEARAEVDNDRANGALQKIGAVREGRLRASFVRDGELIDQYIWSVLKSDRG